MEIVFHKRTDGEHVLEIVREGGERERVVCETRSYLVHDLLHYAVEAEAGLQTGVWGRLSAGATLAWMNDRTRSPAAEDGELMRVEAIVGGLTSALKGVEPEALLARLRLNEDALSWAIPEWLTPAFVRAVLERMRRLQGKWRATPFGHSMTLPWPAPS